MLKEIYS